ncbi:hypothetical protein SBOR_4422 [Sclerotinia borealis F-4128]|uniref:F-box domain-containing protein n=1 Tax=Sclerotinia borealis (strain F-4128) TaxID=1432307 RepID=W9CH40_SCLBF|nr:hypothetical protein SBOR_4422 [Sclerotinia borealis F-4128]
MNKVSAEVIRLIIAKVEDFRDLKALRFVSKSVSVPATEELFSYCSLYLQGLHAQEGDDGREDVEEDNGEEQEGEVIGEMASTIKSRSKTDMEARTNLEKVLSVSHLKQAIYTIRYITNLDPNLSMDEYNEDSQPFSAFTTPMRNLVENSVPIGRKKMVGSFILLEHKIAMNIALLFLRRKLFAALNNPKFPTPDFTTLSLKNLQNVNDPILTKSENFLAVLNRITNLRIRVVVEYDEASPASSWGFAPMHDFFTQFPSTWLAPCTQNLTSLTLHCCEFWGYFPRCDWRDVHFPQLKKLELGNYTFSHDWQLDWILSHGDTLEVLVLNNCPIVSAIRQFGDASEEKYVMEPTKDSGSENVWYYRTKWADHFRKMQDSILKLRLLQIGTGTWLHGKGFDCAEMELVEVSGVPKDLGSYYNSYKPPPKFPYTYFNRGLGPSPWVGTEDFSKDSDDEESTVSEDGDEKDISISVNNDPTFEAERDQSGFDELMTSIGSRLQQ